jgi:predicted nucleic acid binding AN1-type Zn finger protein
MSGTMSDKAPNRCGCCKKKLTLTDFTCNKCSARFCVQHRLPELHSCPFDYRDEGRANLTKQNPRIIGDKLDRI